MTGESLLVEMEHLIERIRKGDPSAEEAFLAHYKVIERIQLMFQVRLAAGAPLPDYLVDEVIELLLYHIREGKYDPEASPVGTYLWRLAKSRINAYLEN